jgi:hypothetical protein
MLVAAAARSAGAGFEIVRFRHATEFECFQNVLRNGFLNFVHLALGFEEAFDDRIAGGGIAFLFEVGDFRLGQLHTLVLFVMKKFAFFIESLELFLGFGVLQKSIHAAANGAKFRLGEKKLAKLAGFLIDRAVSNRFHSF